MPDPFDNVTRPNAALAERERAVLFADICGSTELYEQLGDNGAAATVFACLGQLAAYVAEAGGRVIQRIGDELMCVFPSAAAALDAAARMQRWTSSHYKETGSPLALRIGCHFGSVIEWADGLFGDVVNVAARTAEFASAGTIMLTEQVVGQLSPSIRDRLRLVAPVTFKGKRGTISIYELLWRDDGHSTFALVQDKSLPARMQLTAAGSSVELTAAGRRTATIGRDPSCDFIVTDGQASRRHARVEVRGQNFVVVDQSLNGTWIQISGTGIPLHRQEMIVSGSGSIRIGGPTGTSIAFSCD